MIIFTMAGQSRRFVEAGFDLPKWMLPLAGKPVLEWVLLSFSDYFDTDQFVLAFRDENDSRSFIENSLNSVGLMSANLIDVGGPTRGQAETVGIALERVGLEGDQPFLVCNIDTLLPKFSLPNRETLGDGWIQCVEVPGESWSFVLPESAGSRKVLRVAEKSRISNYASTGAYFFGQASVFQHALRKSLRNSAAVELFVAPLYMDLIAASCEVFFDLIPRADVYFCGTPEDYYRCLAVQEEIEAAYVL